MLGILIGFAIEIEYHLASCLYPLVTNMSQLSRPMTRSPHAP